MRSRAGWRGMAPDYTRSPLSDPRKYSLNRSLALLLTLAALGATLTGCAIHPPHLGPRIVVGGDDHHDNGRHRGHDKQKHKNKHRHDD